MGQVPHRPQPSIVGLTTMDPGRETPRTRQRTGLARLAWFGVALALVCGIAWIDYVTSTEVLVNSLYFGAIILGAWRSGRAAAITLALASSIGWGLANASAGLQYSSDYIWIVNGSTQGITFGALGLLIVELRERNEKERLLARVDALTGLLNLRALREEAQRELARAKRSGDGLAVAFIDLDNFKQLNDRRGHEEGNAVLRAMAEALGHLRVTDLRARVGGDEFVAILPATGAEGAELAVGRVLESFGRISAEKSWGVGASAGIRVFTAVPSMIDELLRSADELMYRAKHAGKGHIVTEAAAERDAVASDEASSPASP